jgi:hypothetical protein
MGRALMVLLALATLSGFGANKKLVTEEKMARKPATTFSIPMEDGEWVQSLNWREDPYQQTSRERRLWWLVPAQSHEYLYFGLGDRCDRRYGFRSCP